VKAASAWAIRPQGRKSVWMRSLPEPSEGDVDQWGVRGNLRLPVHSQLYADSELNVSGRTRLFN